MKKINIKMFCIIMLFISSVLVMESCKEEWLEPKPLSLFTPETALVDSRGMYAALASADKAIRAEFYHPGGRRLWFELAFTEAVVCGTTDRAGPPMNMNVQITPISHQHSDNRNMLRYWDEAYQIIKYANLVISRIDNTDFANEDERNAVLGTAYFHRAYQYYRLVHQFGDVPFIGREITEPKLDFYSTEREVILRKLKKDMDFAVKWVSDNVPRGAVTNGACLHLLTKINLALGEFDDAINSASDLINGGVYSLMREPFGSQPREDGNYIRDVMGIVRDDVIAHLHWWENKGLPQNKEVLLLAISVDEYADSRLVTYGMYSCVPFWSCANVNMLYTPDGYGPGTSTRAGEEYELAETFGRGVGTARLTSYATKEVWNGWSGNDLRHTKGNWIEMTDLVYNNSATKKGDYYGKPLQLFDGDRILTLDSIRNWYGWPHYKLYNPDQRLSPPRGGAADWYIFRLAETYLLRAEAYWWKGDNNNAMADVNEVRTRAHAAPFTNPTNFDIGHILDERQRELYQEEPRFTELTRMALIFAKTGKSYRGRTYSLDAIGSNNFWFDRVSEHNNFYNKGVFAVSGQEYTMSPYHIFWPIPQTTIDSNPNGVINQNFGYDGFENNVPPLKEILPEDDI